MSATSVACENIQNIHSVIEPYTFINLVNKAVQTLTCTRFWGLGVFYVCFNAATRGQILTLRISDWLKKERKSMGKINVSRFTPVETATRWNLSWPGKDLTFCTGVNSAFVYFVFFTVSSSDSPLHTWCSVSYIWRLSIVQNTNFWIPVLEYFKTHFPWIKRSRHPLLHRCPREGGGGIWRY